MNGLNPAMGGYVLFTPQTTPEEARTLVRAMHYDVAGSQAGEPLMLRDKATGCVGGIFGKPVFDILLRSLPEGQAADLTRSSIHLRQPLVLEQAVRSFQELIASMGYTKGPNRPLAPSLDTFTATGRPN